MKIITDNINSINIYQENSLHASLKEWYSQPGDRLEAIVQSYIVDIIQDGLLVEIQTRNFSSIKSKLFRLAQTHPVRLVKPIASKKWIIKRYPSGLEKRRKSPKEGKIEDIFYELVRIYPLLTEPNFSLEVLLIAEEEIQVPDKEIKRRSSWRRKGWAIADRRLVEVYSSTLFTNLDDYREFLEGITTHQEFSSLDLATKMNIPVRLAQKMIYCFNKTGLIKITGNKNRYRLYQLSG